MAPDIREFLLKLAKSDASDLHLCAGSPPCLRTFGKIAPMPDTAPIDFRDNEEMIFRLLTEEQRSRLLGDRELDFSIGFPDVGRFRGNIHKQRGSWAVAFRKIPLKIPSLTELGLPDIARSLALKESGLVLVTGPTGSGKSMTLAAMIEVINSTRPCHIITIEDPIEFLFKNNKAIIKQREIGTDTENYETALRHIFRQDPDVVMIGELRERETIAMAITAASTGRLVLGTLHTMDAAASIDRLVESFPNEQQVLMRSQIAGCLEGIISQQLVTRMDGSGRVLSPEIMVSTPSIRNLIRGGKTFQILTDMETGKRFGMQSMNQALQALVQSDLIRLEDVLRHTRFPDLLMQKLGVPQ
ncbi:MAG: PilT/PilU family type 4a pilus ATPase [Elusimicrobia bacterium]|nr:PilT/PilU family type 4a pilus ATPase [Elusimicrobiota bacterium]